MIGPAELEDIRLDLEAAITGPGAAAEPCHPSFHPGAAMLRAEQDAAAPDAAVPAADQPSCVSSNSSGLSTGTR